MKLSYVAAGTVLLISMVATLLAFTGAVARHVTVRDAISQPGQLVQVPGKIVKSSVAMQPGKLIFVVQDAKTGETMPVEYDQAKPENFDTAVGVEAVGKYQAGVFHATNLLVKCPSKYNDSKAKKY